jgi:ribosomal protein S18 acetylase RimI-like enzyme
LNANILINNFYIGLLLSILDNSLTLRVVQLTESFKEDFLKYVNQDPLDYYFFILDWKLYRDKTKFLLALEQNKIKGVMLIYKDYIVQLRGSRDAIEMLLNHLDLKKVSLTLPEGCEDLVLKNYKPLISGKLILMYLKRGEEKIQIKYKPIRLFEEDAENIADLLRNTNPEWWSDIKAEQIKEGMKEIFWLGIKINGKIVSVGNTRFFKLGSNIGVVATHEAYRNRGYATSIVSALVKEILQRSERALIHVLSDNFPAIHIYEKVGFKPYKSYFLIRAARKSRLGILS